MVVPITIGLLKKSQHIRMTSADIEKQILEAISSGDIKAIESQLQASRTTIKEYRQADGASLLHLSVVCGPASLTKELIARGIDVNIQTKSDKATALHMAASSGRLTTVELLLECPEIDDTLRDSADRSALDIAHSKPIETAICYARSKYVENIISALHNAVQQNNPTKIKELMSTNRAIVLVDVNTADANGETILHKGAKGSRKNIVQACLSIGANPFAKNSRGKLPLELSRSEEIRNLLKNAPMVGSSELDLIDENLKVSGYLQKYVNFASGYRRRFVVLENGLLSYYKTKDDYPVSCKGSLNVQFARLISPPGDNLGFELRTMKYSLYFRAENEVDATRWKVTLSRWQRHRSDTDLPSQVDAIAAARALHSRPCTPTSTTGLEDYKRALNAARDCLSQLESRLIGANSDALPDVQSCSAPDPVTQQLLHSLQEFIAVCAQREQYWQGHIELEIRQRIMIEETLKRIRHRSRDLRPGMLYDNSESLPELGEYTDEFYDALEEAEAIAALSISEERSELLTSIESESISPSNSPGKLEEFDVTEISVPPEDLEFIEDGLIGYELVHRTRIPVDSTKIPPISIWNIIKNAIGKDLTRIPIPVNFSEPISMLQRLAEDLEYADLLYMASIAEDPLMRLQYVAAFAISPYASTDGRIYKPFNPLLGETFEYVSRKHGYRYISEQVSHHPPVSACFCESARFAYYAEVLVKTKSWGKSLELIPEGINHVQLKTTGEHFSYRKVNTAVYNLIMGKMWIDHYGTMRIVNHTTGQIAEIEFKPTGWRTADPKRIEGFAYDNTGLPKYTLEGYWNKELKTRNLETGELIELWRRRPLPPWSDKMYNFTYLTMTLNELSPSLTSVICPTDSRLRPDQRAMEDGRFDEANVIKLKLEEKQRATCKERGTDPNYVFNPRWFTQETDRDTGEPYWKYIGEYWANRAAGKWGASHNIYLSDTESSTSLSLSSKSNKNDPSSVSAYTEESSK